MAEQTVETGVTPEDMPIVQSDVIEVQDKPIVTDQLPALDNMVRVHAASVKGYNEDKGILEAYTEVEGEPNINQTIQQLIGEKRELDKEQLIFDFVDNPGDVTNVQVTRDLIAEQDTQSDAAHIVQATMGAAADPDTAIRIESQLRMSMDLKKIWDDMSKLDVGLEVASFLVPLGAVVDNVDSTGSAFGAEEIVRDMVIGFKNLSTEEQVKAWPAIKDHFIEAMPNLRAISALGAFLDPVGEEKLSDFNAWWAALDTADAALIGVGIAKRVITLGKQLNAVKVMKNLENVEDAVDVNTVAVMDETGAASTKAGIDKTTAHSNALPFNQNKIDEAYTEGMSADSVARMDKIRVSQQRTAAGIFDEAQILREDLLSPAEKVLAEEKFTKELNTLGFDNITTIKRERSAVTMQYTVQDGDKLIVKNQKFNLTLDEKTGVFISDPVGVMKRSITSPNVMMKGDAAAVEAAARINSTQDKVANQLQTLQAEALEPILGKTAINTLVPKAVKGSARQKLADLDDVLLTGDNANKVYTARELKAGVNGVPLDDKQIEAYYNMRGLFDNLFQIRNAETRNKFIQKGMQQIETSQGKRIGKPYRTLQAAQGSINTHLPVSVWDEGSNRLLFAKDLKLAEKYDKGFNLVRLEDAPLEIGKGNPHDFILVRNASKSELPEQVLRFKEGYVPRVNKNAYWFVKEQKSSILNGRVNANANFKTVRYFDNEQEARAFEQQLKTENPELSYRTLEDREAEKQAFGSTGLGAGGGLYTGARSSEPLRFGKDGLPGERIGAYESLSQNINSVSKFSSQNEWRMGMEQKWLNTVKEAGLDASQGFRHTDIPDTRVGRHLEQMREQIKDWMGVPSKGERQWDVTVQEMAEWAQNSGFKKTGAAIHKLDHVDPISAARAGAFHSLLGWFNPSQLWVQAQGAAVSVSIATTRRDPLGGLIAIKNQFALQMASLTESPGALAKIAKNAGLKTDELVEMRQLWKKSGQEDSVLSTADHRASLAGHGLAMEALSRASDKGLFFYRHGELMNRRIAFSTALREFKLANKGKKVSDDELKTILARSNDFQLNLMRANRAAFQKGLVSLPTQFLQVQAKMTESILGLNGKFTSGERAKMLLGQLALYGTAGIPLGDFAIKSIASGFGATQKDIEDLSPLARKTMNEGFWGMIALSAFEADVDLGKRGSTASGIEDFTFDLLFSDKKISEALLGAFGQVPHRFFQAYGKIKPMFIGADNETVWPSKEQFASAVWEVGKITSTLSNADKAFMMANWNLILDRNNMVISDDPQSAGTIFGQALGFQASVAGRVRDLQTVNREQSEYRKKIANMITNNMWTYSKIATAADLTDAKRAELIQRHTDTNTALLQGLGSNRDRQLVREAIRSRMQNPTTIEEREIKKFIQGHSQGQLTELQTWKSTLTTRGVLATGVLDDQIEE